jgi:UDP-glucose-4-epimerase GalE
MNSGRVLITGGAGYVGSHFARACDRAGVPYIVLDDLSRGCSEFLREDVFIRGDIGDKDLIADVVRQREIDCVVHFAAFAYVGESTKNPALYYRNNVAKMLDLMEALETSGVRRFVFSSSCATFGVVDGGVRIHEGIPQRPINPYGFTKFAGEKMLADFEKAYGWSVAILRYFNACGTSPDGDLFEQHDPETHLIPLAVQAALDGTELEVFGNDYGTRDGTCIRDYIHVDDLAAAHIAALGRLGNGASSFAANLGRGVGDSVLSVIDAAERVAQERIVVKFGARREGDPAELVADPTHAQNLLQWSARYRDINEIVATAYAGELRRRQARARATH